jgi:hypothetical protein
VIRKLSSDARKFFRRFYLVHVIMICVIKRFFPPDPEEIIIVNMLKEKQAVTDIFRPACQINVINENLLHAHPLPFYAGKNRIVVHRFN